MKETFSEYGHGALYLFGRAVFLAALVFIALSLLPVELGVKVLIVFSVLCAYFFAAYFLQQFLET